MEGLQGEKSWADKDGRLGFGRSDFGTWFR